MKSALMTSFIKKPKDSLADAALNEILARAAPILGTLDHCSKTSKISDWMAAVPDDTKIIHMNLPGTHDTCTWNYTSETQKSLERYTGPLPDARVYRCQQHSIFQMLNEGIRVFDLRYAYNPGLDTIGFYHSKALLSPTTRMEDVLFGLYYWLEKHPTETVLVSMNYEPGTGTPNDASLQERIYRILNDELAKEYYWMQTSGKLGTLGEARGKLTLIQRFDYDLLPSHLTQRIGIHLGPTQWTVNGKSIEHIYNAEDGQVAYIQDHYKLDPSSDSNPESCIEEKFRVIKAHLENAMNPELHPDQLYISFASAAFRQEELSLTPQVYAIGDGKKMAGVNQRLLTWLRGHRGKRLGIVLLDFYDATPGLVETILGLN